MKEFLFKEDEKDDILKKIEFFLNENILSIKKKFQKFIKKISIILDLETFFLVSISVKKNNHNDKIKTNNLNYLLQETKDYCKKTIDGKKIIHMTTKIIILITKIMFIYQVKIIVIVFFRY